MQASLSLFSLFGTLCLAPLYASRLRRSLSYQDSNLE